MRIDLDDLERKTKAADSHRDCCGRHLMDISPRALLALVARIRELEEFGMLGVAAMDGLHEATGRSPYPADIARAKALLAKGVTL